MQTLDFEQKYQQIYQALNAEQQQVVNILFGPVLVNAGAGTGKTQLLSTRVANILRQTDTLPNHILCLTYTDAAATNMRDRLYQIIGPLSYRIAIHTFHSFSLEIMNRYPEYFFQGATFNLAEELVKKEILLGIFKSLPLSNPMKSFCSEIGFVYAKDVSEWIDNLKKEGLSPDLFRELLELNQKTLEHLQQIVDTTPFLQNRISKKVLTNLETWFFELQKALEADGQEYEKHPVFYRYNLVQHYLQTLDLAIQEFLTEEKTQKLSKWKEQHLQNGKLKDLENLDKLKILADIYEKYQQEMERKCLIDFSDMLLEVIKCFRQEANQNLLKHIQECNEFILVDEFQDTSGVQLILLNLLVGNNPEPNLLVVGDTNQTIYKFQGASSDNMKNFKVRYPTAKEICLNKNYRSRQEILDFAHTIISNPTNKIKLISCLDTN